MKRLSMLLLCALATACGAESEPGPDPGTATAGDGDTSGDPANPDAPDDRPDDPDDPMGDDIPPPPPGGVQMVTPEFAIPPATEMFVCMRVPFEVTEDMFVQSSAIYQRDAGHHTLLFYSENGNPGVDPLPHECSGADMTDVRIVTAGAAMGSGLSMPDGVVLKLPKGAELWVQSHYINATDNERVVQDVINLELIPESEVREVASTFAHVDLTFALPPKQESTRVIECKLPRRMTVPWLLPHMHEWGKSFKIEIFDDERTIFEWEGDWFDGARNDFPVQELDVPLELGPEHTIRTTCNWLNTEETPLLWPQEMCVTFFPFYPGDGTLMACDASGEVFEP